MFDTCLLGNSMSSMVSGRGMPLVSGSSSTKPPARKAREPAQESPNYPSCSWKARLLANVLRYEPTKDDEGQLQPDDCQPVEKEGSNHSTNVTQSGTDGHAQVPVQEKTL